MPKTKKNGTSKTKKRAKLKKSDLPSPVRRSEKKARKTFAKTYASAMATYDDEARANATAYAALKHSYEKVGDHWEAKDEPGPSDAHAEKGGPNVAEKTAGGVNANATKEHLLGIARRLDIRGRSTMTKDELVTAIQKANDQANAQARTS